MAMKMHAIKRDQKGFTLMELMIALTILVIGLLAAASMQAVAVNNNAFAMRHSKITEISQMVLDDLLSQYLTPNPSPFGNAYYQQLNPNPTNVTAQAIAPVLYNQFPPFNKVTNNVPITTYIVPNLGQFQATYSVTTNTPARNISRITVQLFIWNQANAAFQPVPFSLTGYRSIPSM